MKNKYFFGMFLIGLGILYFFDLFEISMEEIEVIKDYWGIIFVLFGIHFLSKNKLLSNLVLSLCGLYCSGYIYLIFSGLIFEC